MKEYYDHSYNNSLRTIETLNMINLKLLIELPMVSTINLFSVFKKIGKRKARMILLVVQNGILPRSYFTALTASQLCVKKTSLQNVCI